MKKQFLIFPIITFLTGCTFQWNGSGVDSFAKFIGDKPNVQCKSTPWGMTFSIERPDNFTGDALSNIIAKIVGGSSASKDEKAIEALNDIANDSNNTDTVRANAMGIIGTYVNKTPNLDKLKEVLKQLGCNKP